MNKPILTKYEFSFPVAGQASPCYFDVRCIMCKGVPSRFDKKAILPERQVYLDELLLYISDRSDPAKRNMYNHFRQYVLWAESCDITPFTQPAIDLFNKSEHADKRKMSVNRLHRILGMTPPSVGMRRKVKRDRLGRKKVQMNLQSAAPEQYSVIDEREGFVFSTDGKHRIYAKSRSNGVIRVDLTDRINHLDDKFEFLSALKEMFDSCSGDTFTSKVFKIKEYLPFVKQTFFSVTSLSAFVESQHQSVLLKKKGATQGRRKANVVAELFSFAEVQIPIALKKNIARLPNPRSKPVPAYVSDDYKDLIRLLLNIQRQAHRKLMENSYFGVIQGTSNEFRCLGFADIMSTFMSASYYLIARYSAWTDSTLKNIMVDDIQFEKQDGEWIHLKGFKPRSGYKDLELTLHNGPPDVAAIRKTGYRLIQDILRISDHFSISHKNLLFTVKSNGEIRPLRLQGRLRELILNEIPGLGSINSQRIRETEIAMAYEKGFQSAVKRSGSTSSVVKRHYSNGLPGETNKQLSEAAKAIADVAHSGIKQESTKDIKQRLYNSYSIPILNEAKANTPMGTRCQDAQSESSFSVRSKKRGLGDLSCADLTSCFGCKHAAIVDSANDIWNLLSFRQHLEEGKIFSVDRIHHGKNFNETLAKIDIAIESCDPENVISAKEKYAQDGPHPFWAGDEFL